MKMRTLLFIVLAVALLAIAAYASGGGALLRDLGLKIHGPR